MSAGNSPPIRCKSPEVTLRPACIIETGNEEGVLSWEAKSWLGTNAAPATLFKNVRLFIALIYMFIHSYKQSR